jgi:hypothetical protein
MTQDAIVELADAWIRYWEAPEDSVERGDFDLAMRFHDIEYHLPRILWAMILAIHLRDQSTHIQQVLSAGPLECGIGVDGTEPWNSFLQNIDYEKAYSSLSGCRAMFFSPAAFFSL